MRFGGFVLEARDQVSYVAKATEGLAGHWLYHDPYTSEVHPGSLIYLPISRWASWTACCTSLSRCSSRPLAWRLQAALLVAVYRLSQAVFGDRARSRLGFALAVFGGGVGVLGHANILGYHFVSLDRGVSGTVGLETISVAPHIVLACLACAWLALLWVRRGSAPRARDLAAGLLWTLALASAYPQMAVLWAGVGVVAWVLAPVRGRLLLAGSFVVGAVPYAAYGLYLKQSNPIFASWPPQSDIDVGDPLSYLLWGHLLMLPFLVLVGARLLRRRRRSADEYRRGGPLELFAVWVAASALLMYLPGLPTVMHRVFYASFIPFGILAAAGVSELLARARPRRRRVLRMGVALMGVVSVATVAEGLAIPLQHRDDYALYFPSAEAAVLERLRADAPAGGRLVMNSYLSGLYVPSLSGQTTYVGFPFETLDTPRKEQVATAFYRLRSPSEAEQLASSLGIDYVLVGRYERGYSAEDVGAIAGWTVAYREGDAVIYRVKR